MRSLAGTPLPRTSLPRTLSGRKSPPTDAFPTTPVAAAGGASTGTTAHRALFSTYSLHQAGWPPSPRISHYARSPRHPPPPPRNDSHSHGRLPHPPHPTSIPTNAPAVSPRDASEQIRSHYPPPPADLTSTPAAAALRPRPQRLRGGRSGLGRRAADAAVCDDVVRGTSTGQALDLGPVPSERHVDIQSRTWPISFPWTLV